MVFITIRYASAECSCTPELEDHIRCGGRRRQGVVSYCGRAEETPDAFSLPFHLPRAYVRALSRSRARSLSLSRFLALSLSVSLALALSLSLFSLARSLSLSLSLARAHSLLLFSIKMFADIVRFTLLDDIGDAVPGTHSHEYSLQRLCVVNVLGR